jgi:hypothetical protein
VNKSLAVHDLKLSADYEKAAGQESFGLMLFHGHGTRINNLLIERFDATMLYGIFALRSFQLSADRGLSLSQVEYAAQQVAVA